MSKSNFVKVIKFSCCVKNCLYVNMAFVLIGRVRMPQVAPRNEPQCPARRCSAVAVAAPCARAAAWKPVARTIDPPKREPRAYTY